jgi:hypothetical protein
MPDKIEGIKPWLVISINNSRIADFLFILVNKIKIKIGN